MTERQLEPGGAEEADTLKRARFPWRATYASEAVLEALMTASETTTDLFTRHVTGDWGDVPPEDAELNEAAISNQRQIFSAYTLSNGVNVWVYTTADRSGTVIVLPEEYRSQQTAFTIS